MDKQVDHVARRTFRIDTGHSGTGSAVCGAAAVMATEPIVRAKAEQVTVAVSCVVVFGTLAIFLYPILYDLNTHWILIPAGPRAFGIYAGSTIHEVAQVFAAGRSVSAATADTAVVTKMVRVMILAPLLIALSAWMTRGAGHTHTAVMQSTAASSAKRPRSGSPRMSLRSAMPESSRFCWEACSSSG